jgi:hypothetical protein
VKIVIDLEIAMGEGELMTAAKVGLNRTIKDKRGKRLVLCFQRLGNLCGGFAWPARPPWWTGC